MHRIWTCWLIAKSIIAIQSIPRLLTTQCKLLKYLLLAESGDEMSRQHKFRDGSNSVIQGLNRPCSAAECSAELPKVTFSGALIAQFGQKH
jgi:hypothetical protein